MALLRGSITAGDKLLKDGKLYTVSSVDGSLFLYNDSDPVVKPMWFNQGVKKLDEMSDNEIETYTKIQVDYGVKIETPEKVKRSTDG